MNRTSLLLASAAVLALAAVVSGRKHGAASNPVVIPPRPAVVVAPPVQSRAVAGPLTVTAQLSHGKLLAGTSTASAMIDVAAAPNPAQAGRKPVSLALAIDHSGSMAGQKMGSALAAARALLEQLEPHDRIAIVAFGTDVQVFPSAAASPKTLSDARAFVDRIVSVGSTNIGDALEMSYRELRPYVAKYAVSRVVLLSDGVPTDGLTDPNELASRATAWRARGITTSAMGVGLDFNVELMRALAANGAGRHAYVENTEKIGLAFADELRDAAHVVARDVEVRLTPAQGVAICDVPGHLFSREGAQVVVHLYDFSAAQSAQLLVQLQVASHEQGLTDVVGVQLSAVDLVEDRAVSGQLSLRAAMTDALAEVVASADPQVASMGRRVEISQRLLEATKAADEGDQRHAVDLLTDLRRTFGELADDVAGRSLEDDIRLNNVSPQASRQLMYKTMKNFGENNTTQY